MAVEQRDPSSNANFQELVVTHVDIVWNVNFEQKKIGGSSRLYIKALKATKQLVLDGQGLNLKSIKSEGKHLEFSLTKNSIFGETIHIEMDPIEPGQERTVDFEYESGQNASALQFLGKEFTKDQKEPFLFSQCQAVYCRSILPCMDTPAVKHTYSAKVSVPSHLTCLMSAVSGDKTVSGDRAVFEFKQSVPIPIYLLAIVVGHLEKRDISDRCAVWAEPSLVDSAAYEFADTEKMLKTAEDLAGPYVWGRYDLVVLPPSFPFGGMENPCLTFVTPSLIAGDRSLASVIAHEIAHSWTGNLVTNANWEHFWLNEGFTVFLERKIMGRLYGEKVRQFQAVCGWEDHMLPCIHEAFGPTHPYTQLITNLENADPEDSYSEIPYEKGSAFLMYIEQQIGSNERFEEFLRAYLQKFKYQSISTQDWRDFLYEFFADEKEILDKIDFETWLRQPGIPPNKPKYDETLIEACRNLAKQWTSSADVNSITCDGFSAMSSEEKTKVLQCIRAECPLPEQKIKCLAETYKLDKSPNCEILFAYTEIICKSRWLEGLPVALRFITTYGRLKYLKPLFKDLFAWPAARNKAIEQFNKNVPVMHPISVHVIKRMLETEGKK
ncbi:hypothetical protein L596_014563 [Steinernema carpocapsae]|uniref:Peptidase M1 leukotriene A4 hydrolase/aminopeptidase C-terminal domain-containing protein n=1 Tax=Steinernema carpocapsae TaxID=34508 RepID=A0A4U5ND43_STECR|nr:hypothetical protein L596_014563 [Steinernema carpocapsae]